MSKITIMTNAQREQSWDKLLKIKTSGRDDSKADQYRYPYEPTPYTVLERLANSGYIGKRNVLLDYGCGKGRVDFFLSYQCRCRSIGIEYDERIYQTAIDNTENAVSSSKVTFLCENAEHYTIPTEVDRFYFFNPFSIEILRSFLSHILDSYYKSTRDIFLFFYYPQLEYISYLMTVDELYFYDEIDCMDLFVENDTRERIVIFKLDA